MRTQAIIIPLFLLSIGSAFAQGSSTGARQLNLPLLARSASLGSATVADIGAFSSTLVNPANLWTDGSVDVAISHSQWIQDISTELVGTQIPLSAGTFGITVCNTNVRGIEIREIPGPPIGTFTARFASFQGSFATNISDDLIVGIAGKYIYEKLYIDEATGFGFDLGVVYRTPVKNLTAGASLTNIGKLGKFRSESSQLPTFARLGASYILPFDEFRFGLYTAISENIHLRDEYTHLGIEVSYQESLALRLGYELGYESRGLSAGLGTHYDFVHIDYAYVPFRLGFGEAHIFAVGFQF